MGSEPGEPQPIYVFLDESGDFGFTPKGSKYFVLTALTCRRPFSWEQKLSDLRFSLWEKHSLDVEYFHATEDQQLVRSHFVETITPHLPEFRVDSVIVEKRKAYPPLHSVERLYPMMMGYLLKYVFQGYGIRTCPDIRVVTDQIPVKKKRDAIEKSIKVTLASMITSQQKYSISHRDSKSCFGLQIADYFSWAIFKKWERQDTRTYELLESSIRRGSEFDIFERGRTHHY